MNRCKTRSILAPVRGWENDVYDEIGEQQRVSVLILSAGKGRKICAVNEFPFALRARTEIVIATLSVETFQSNLHAGLHFRPGLE